SRYLLRISGLHRRPPTQAPVCLRDDRNPVVGGDFRWAKECWPGTLWTGATPKFHGSSNGSSPAVQSALVGLLRAALKPTTSFDGWTRTPEVRTPSSAAGSNSTGLGFS